MKPQIRKLTLTSHITASIGWLGAVIVFLMLAIIGLTNQDSLVTRSAYIAMELSAWYVIVPLCLASLFTGIIQAVGTKWGLFKYYWIVVKLFLTIVLTAFLLLHLKPISYLAGLAMDTDLVTTQEYSKRVQVLVEAGAAIVVLLVITTISVYKPWGKLNYGISRLNTVGSDENRQVNSKKPMRLYLLITLTAVILLFIIIHLFGGRMGGH